jgi:hypothetical protein
MVGQFAAHKGAGDMRLAGVGPAEDFGLLVLGRFQLAQRARHGHHVQQRHAGLELGVEHDGAVDIADRPVGRAFQDLHHAGEMQQHPHHEAGGHSGHAGPAVKAVSQHDDRNAGHGNKDFLEVHGAILAGRQKGPLRAGRVAQEAWRRRRPVRSGQPRRYPGAAVGRHRN